MFPRIKLICSFVMVIKWVCGFVMLVIDHTVKIKPFCVCVCLCLLIDWFWFVFCVLGDRFMLMTPSMKEFIFSRLNNSAKKKSMPKSLNSTKWFIVILGTNNTFANVWPTAPAWCCGMTMKFVMTGEHSNKIRCPILWTGSWLWLVAKCIGVSFFPRWC